MSIGMVFVIVIGVAMVGFLGVLLYYSLPHKEI